MTLVEFQTAFWRDLWAEADDRAPPEGPAAQPGFAVYRNTVLKGCAEALVSLYPAVHRLVGDDWMRAVALGAARAREWFARKPRRLDALGATGGGMMIALGVTLVATDA